MTRNCSECQSDPYFAREFPRVRDESHYWQQEAKRLAARVAALELDAEFARWQVRTDVAWLQGKVVAQARELKRLNDARNVRRMKAGMEPSEDRLAPSLTPLETQAMPGSSLS